MPIVYEAQDYAPCLTFKALEQALHYKIVCVCVCVYKHT